MDPSTDPDFPIYLDGLVERFERRSFIASDPIAIPHGFEDPLDQEVIGLFTALLAWGRRQTILNKLADLCERMSYKPYQFVYDFASSPNQSALIGFVHRTFQPTDALHFTRNLSVCLRKHKSVEAMFVSEAGDVKQRLEAFSSMILSAHPETPKRLGKHVARPSSGSACKRLNMYLRWMVRPGPVDFGHWTNLSPADLMLPLDVHSGTQARLLGMLSRKVNDWRATEELTSRCRLLDAEDPCKYDFAFFGAGAYDEPLDPRFVIDKGPD